MRARRRQAAGSVAGTIVALSLLANVSSAEPAFDYRLRDLDGVEYRASESRGKWLVINFWATWCTPCLEEMPQLEKFYRDNRGRADLWGVTFEDTDIDAIRRFVARLGVTYPILGHGQDPKTGYGTVRVLPTTFVIDSQGEPRRVHGVADLVAGPPAVEHRGHGSEAHRRPEREDRLRPVRGADAEGVHGFASSVGGPPGHQAVEPVPL